MDSDMVNISRYQVERSLLTAMDEELRGYLGNIDRLNYLCDQQYEIPRQSPPPTTGMPRGLTPGDPTQSRATKLAEDAQTIQKLRAWLKAVDAVRNRLSLVQKGVCNYFYFLPWDERDHTIKALCGRLKVSSPQVYRVRDEALLEFMKVINGYSPRESVQTCSEPEVNP